MAALGKVGIRIDIEPIVKLMCMETECKHHLDAHGWMACNLKHVSLGEAGICMDFEPDPNRQNHEDVEEG